MLLCPRRRLRIHPAVTQQHLRHPMPRVHQIPPARVMRADQLPRRLDLRRRDHDRVSAIRPSSSGPAARRPCDRSSPDPSARAGSGPARSPPSRSPPRPPPDTNRTRSGPPHSTPAPGRGSDHNHATGVSNPGPNRTLVSSPAHHIDRRGMRRPSMDIQPNPRHRSGHGRTSSTHLGVSRSRSPARQTPARSVRPLSPAGNPCNGRPTP